MNTQVANKNLVIETIRALWRKRDIQGGLALMVRIPDTISRKIWEATLHIAKAELSGDALPVEIDEHWFDDVDLDHLPVDIMIDAQLVKGRIALTKEHSKLAEDYFFASLLASREKNYLLGKVQSMIGLGKVKLRKNQFEQTYEMVITANSLAEKLPQPQRKFLVNEALLLQCQVHLSIQNYDLLAPNAQKLLDSSKESGDTHKYVHALNFMAVAHAASGDYKASMPFFLEALDICNKINYSSLAIKISTNIATIHGQLNNYGEALERYLSILQEYKTPIRPTKRGFIYNNIGNLYTRLGDWKRAIGYFLDAEEIANKEEHQPLKKLAFCQISRCLIELKSYEAYLTHMKSEGEIFKSQKSNGLQILFYTKAKYALSQENYGDTIQFSIQAINIAKEFGDDTTLLQTKSILAQAYEKNGDLAAALDVYKKYAAKKEATEREYARNMVVNAEIDYILSSKEKEINTLQRENQLQSELIKSTSLIRKKNTELVAKNEELSYFAKMIALNFNKHLRVIHQFVEALEHEETTPKTKEYLSFIINAVGKIAQLVDGLHQHANILNDELSTKKIALGDVLKVVEHDFASLIDSHNVQLIYSDNLPVLSFDKKQLSMIFMELIQNAIRFSVEPPIIKITSKTYHDSHILTISDNGIGVPDGDERKIFWAFYRTGRHEDKEGNGLGLAACKKIIELYGGTIKATNKKPNGIIITIVLPKEHQQDTINQEKI